jgi:hypothetical protein
MTKFFFKVQLASSTALDQIDNGVDLNRINERRLKGMSTCSELDVYFKDCMNSAGPQIDTNSSE